MEVNARSRTVLIVINISEIGKFHYSDQQVEAHLNCILLIDTYSNSFIVFAANSTKVIQ